MPLSVYTTLRTGSCKLDLYRDYNCARRRRQRPRAALHAERALGRLVGGLVRLRGLGAASLMGWLPFAAIGGQHTFNRPRTAASIGPLPGPRSPVNRLVPLIEHCRF